MQALIGKKALFPYLANMVLRENVKKSVNTNENKCLFSSRHFLLDVFGKQPYLFRFSLIKDQFFEIP